MTFPLFDFAGAHPWVFCWAIWPVAVWLISLAWCVTVLSTQGLNFVLSIGNLVGNTMVLLIRGYAPQSAEAVETEPETTEEE